MKKYFIDSDGKNRGEVLTDSPVNPDNFLVIETDLEPPPYVYNPQLSDEEKNAERKKDIKNELLALDLTSIRSLRAIAAGTAKKSDTDKIAEIEAETEELREELRGGIAATDELAKTELGFFRRVFSRWF